MAYLYLQLSSIQLVGVIDENKKNSTFFEQKVVGLNAIHALEWDCILLTRLEKIDDDMSTLKKKGIYSERIMTL